MTHANLAATMQADPTRALRELDPRYFIENHFWIYDREGHRVLLVLNEIQAKIYAEIEACWRRGEPARLIVLKARRFGVSSLAIALLLQTAIYAPGSECLIESHDMGSANFLFKILMIGFDGLRVPEKPKASRSAGGELVFVRPHDARITVETGRSKTSGRSFQLKAALLSELAFWLNPRDAALGIESAMSDTDAHSLVIKESTANGASGYFYNDYQNAKKGKSGLYKALFYAWHDFSLYRRDPERDHIGEKDLSDRELAIMEKYHLDMLQMAWYRWVLVNKCGNNEDLRAQEYPSDDEEAFLTSGQCRFKHSTLLRLPVSENFVRGHFDFTREVGKIVGAKFVKSDKGFLRVWEKPSPNTPYVIGVDVSEGVGLDDSAAVVLNVATMTQAAEIVGQFDPDEELGIIIYLLGRMFNWALLGVEVPGPGATTQARLLTLRYPRNRMYAYKDVLNPNEQESSRYGWRQTDVTRSMGINHLASALDGGELCVKSEEAVKQFRKFVLRNKSTDTLGGRAKWKWEADSGEKDDIVMAWVIAVELTQDPRARFVPGTIKPRLAQRVSDADQDEDSDRASRRMKRPVWSSY